MLAKNALSTWGIFFFVVAAAAPLTVMAGAAPLAFRLGGIGTPGAYVAAGVVFMLFALGFTAMSEHVTNAGAFYAYIAHGLGKPLGVGAALIAVFSYSVICIGFYGALAFFTKVTLLDFFGVDTPWQLWAFIGIGVVAVLGYRQIDVGAKVLGVLMVGEVAILFIVALAVLIKGGPEPMSVTPFLPQNVFASGAGAMFVLAFGAFIGFEGTAIYAEEASEPKKTIPRATYLALGFLALFYGFITYVATVAYGAKAIVPFALSDTFQDMYFAAANSYVGHWAEVIMRVLIITSIFAALVAFHNACARYFYSLGRERILPKALGRTHPVFKSPYVASLLQTGLSIVIVGMFALAHADPYLHLLLWTNGVGIIGIVFCQFLCAVAVVGFFRRDRRDHSLGRVIVAPALGAVGLAAGLYLMVTNFELLTGVVGSANWALVSPLLVLLVVGIVVAYVIKSRSPAQYAALGDPPTEDAP